MLGDACRVLSGLLDSEGSDPADRNRRRQLTAGADGDAGGGAHGDDGDLGALLSRGQGCRVHSVGAQLVRQVHSGITTPGSKECDFIANYNRWIVAVAFRHAGCDEQYLAIFGLKSSETGIVELCICWLEQTAVHMFIF